MKRPFAAAGCIYLASIFMLMFFPLSVMLVVITALLLVSAVAAVLRHFHTMPLLLTACLCSICAVLSFSYEKACVYQPSLMYEGQHRTVSGEAADYPENNGDTQLVSLRSCSINGEQTALRISFYTDADNAILPGDTVTFTDAQLSENADDGIFYYHSLSKKVPLTAGFVKNIQVSEGDGGSLSFRFLSFRQNIKNIITAYTDESYAALIKALLLGDTASIDDGTSASFRRCGISHLFAVSGLHLSLWSGLIFLVLGKRSKYSALPNIFAILFVLFYITLTGFSPSVIRAGIMLITVYAAALFGRRADTLNSLGLAVLIMLALNPFIAGNISFLLSVSAAGAICTLYKLICKHKTEKLSYSPSLIKNRLRKLPSAIALSCSVLLFTIPASACFFGYTSLLSPLANLLCSLPAETAMIFSALGIIFNKAGIVGILFFKVASAACSLLIKTVTALSSLSFAVCSLKPQMILPWFAASLAVCLTVFFITKKNTAKTLISVLGCVVLLLTALITDEITNKNDINIFIPSGGNSTCVAITAGNGSFSAIIGSGGNYSSTRSVTSFLGKNGVSDTDFLIIPRASTAENGNTAYYLTKYMPLHFADCSDGVTAAKITLFEGCTLSTENRSGFCASLLLYNNKKAVFCFLPSSDFTAADSSYKSGDYLLCRGQLPKGLDCEQFGQIIVFSDKTSEVLSLPSNAASTADFPEGYTLTIK